MVQCRHPKVRRPERPIPDWRATCPDCDEAVTHDGKGGFVTFREVNASIADAVTITVSKVDALALALGPLDYAVKVSAGKVEGGGSPMNVRKALARELRAKCEWPEDDE